MSIRSVAGGEGEDFAPREEEHARWRLPVPHVAKLGGAFELRLGNARGSSRLAKIQDVVESRGGGLFRRVQTRVAGELEAQVLLVDPYLPAILPGKIGAGIEVVEGSADAAVRLHVRFDNEETDDAGGGSWSGTHGGRVSRLQEP